MAPPDPPHKANRKHDTPWKRAPNESSGDDHHNLTSAYSKWSYCALAYVKGGGKLRNVTYHSRLCALDGCLSAPEGYVDAKGSVKHGER